MTTATTNNNAADAPDYQLIRIRAAVLELLKSFFLKEPDGEMLASWRGALTAMKEQDLEPGLSRAVGNLDQMLHKMDLAAIRDEYYELFVNPYSDDRVPTNACYHMDGKMFGESFVRLKEILAEAAIEKSKDAKGAEDEIPVLLDAYQALILREKRQDEIGSARHAQGLLLNEILLPFSERFASALAGNPRAIFYHGCADFMVHCLGLERALFA